MERVVIKKRRKKRIRTTVLGLFCLFLLLLGETPAFPQTSQRLSVSPKNAYAAFEPSNFYTWTENENSAHLWNLPSDGDAWTENDNITYTWKFSTLYRTNNTMSFITSDVRKGSYALNVTHGQSATFLYFRLVLNQNYNISSYDAISFWIKSKSRDSNYDLSIIMNPIDTNWDSKNMVVSPQGCNPSSYNNTWTRCFFPTALFDDYGNANLTSIKQIYFCLKGMASASGTVLLIDNLCFTNYSLSGQTPTTTQLQTMMPITWYSLKKGRKTQTIGSSTYASMYDWMNLKDATLSSTSVETEVLGQTIFALCLAYDKTMFSFYLDEAKSLVEILLAGQEKNGQGKGGVPMYYAGRWDESLSSLYNGWILAGLSHLYHLTSNSTYKNACDNLREFLVGIMWNSTNNCANRIFDNTTQAMEAYGDSYTAMYDGAYSLGLASYYKYVSQNSTVLSRLRSVMNTAFGTTPWDQRMAFDGLKWEDNSYQMWGLWMSYQATSNVTYRDAFLNGTKMLIAKQIQHPSMNGSASRYAGYPFIWGPLTNHNDGWGLHVSLPLFFFANDMEVQNYFVNHVELSLFNHLYSTQSADGGFQRNNYDQPHTQYFGTPSFVVLALQLYHLHRNTDLYVIGSSAKISNVVITSQKMSFTLNGSETSKTYVYCGSKGEPTSVAGATSWSYDSATKILTIDVLHTSLEEEVIVYFADYIPPTTTISLTGAMGDNDWFVSEVSVNLSAVDDVSYVDKTEYSFDNETWTKYTMPFTVNAEGYTSVYYKSTDTVGNVEKIKTETIRIDRTPPSGSIMINNAEAYTGSTSVTLNISADDATSGVAQMRFSNDETNWSDWMSYVSSESWTLTTGDGTKTVYVQFMDNSGLISPSYQDTIKLDTTKPVADAGANQTVNEDTMVTLNASATTDENGVTSFIWTFMDVEPQTLKGKNPTYTLKTPGIYTITLNVTDVAGNWDTDTVVITVVAAQVFPMWIIGAITIVGIIATIAFFFKKRQR